MNDTFVLSREYRDMLRLLGYIYLQNGRAREAAILLSAICAVDPNDRAASESLACAYLRSGDPASALQVLEGFPERFEMTALGHLLRSQALGATGHKAESARSMRRFIMARLEVDKMGES